MNNKRNTLKGCLAACFVICLWSTWLVVSRLGAQSDLTIFDLAALRYGISCLVTVPFVIYFKPWKNLTLFRTIILTSLLGPLYIFCVFGGFCGFFRFWGVQAAQTLILSKEYKGFVKGRRIQEINEFDEKLKIL